MPELAESLRQHGEKEQATRRAALIIATLTSFMTPFVGSSINIALPAIEKAFRMDAVLLSWVPTTYLLAAAIFLVPFGRLADIHGRKRVFAHGVMTFTLSSFLCGASISPLMLIVFRIFQGIGSSMIFATGIAILISVFPPEKRGRVLGINVAAVYSGLTLGPLLGGLLTQYLTWRSVFLINVPFCIAIIFLVHWKLKPEWAEAKGERFDFPGALIYGLALVTVMYGVSRLPATKGFWMIGFGLLGLGAFVGWEKRVESPVFNLTLFTRNRVFALSCLAALIHYSATFAVMFQLSLYLQYIKEISPQQAGFILVVQPAMMAIFSPFAGKLSDTIEPRIIASLGMAFTTLGLAPQMTLSSDSSIVFIMVSLLVLGFGYAFFSSPNTNAIMGSVDRSSYGLASGSVATMRLLGMMISMAIATVILTLFMGRVQILPEHYPLFIKSVRVNFMIFSVLCFFGILASLARGRLRSITANRT